MNMTDNDILLKAYDILKRRAFARQSVTQVGGAASAKRYLAPYFAAQSREVFHVVLLTTANTILHSETVHKGTINSCEIDTRQVARLAIEHNAASVILAHNHPSGNPEPSESDRRITQRIKEGLELFNIDVLDHLIFTDNTNTSMAELGQI